MIERWPHALVLHNKSDLGKASQDRPEGLSISAITGEGISQLVTKVSTQLVPQSPSTGAAVPFEEQQINTLKQALSVILSAISSGDLANALKHLDLLITTHYVTDFT